jgi:adenylyl cyclase-associated protein
VEKKKLTGLPIFEYQDRGHKWVIENHTAESAKKESENGIITVDVTDPKQQVYLYNCFGISVKVNGDKFKSLILDKCEKCNVVFSTIISSAEVVNCKKIQFQTTGVCPVFTIDKTVGCLVWLSKESAAVSSFVSSMSSELNVSFPDGEDMKELPIPEQFVHKLNGTVLKSEVSDLYH